MYGYGVGIGGTSQRQMVNYSHEKKRARNTPLPGTNDSPNVRSYLSVVVTVAAAAVAMIDELFEREFDLPNRRAGIIY